ncbi:MAG: hypothetical protein ACXIUW_18310 [Roseinatronobacter sp.]
MEVFRKRMFKVLLHALVACSPLLITPGKSLANENDAASMWGTGASSTGTQEWKQSSEMHATNGVVAGQVNAARQRVLYSGPNMTVVGSQTIVQVTGNNNILRDIDQSAVNSGDQSLEAPID